MTPPAAPLRLAGAETELCPLGEADALLPYPARLRDWLADDELRTLAGFAVAKRRREWLAARLAAKRLLGRRLAAAGAPRPAPRIRILNAPSREPYVALGAGDAPDRALPISLAHAGGYGACALGEPGALVGVDLERIEPRAPAWRELMADESELTPELAASAESLTRLWCAKEAVLKLLGTGLSVELRGVRPREDGSVRLLGAALARWTERGGRPIRVHFARPHDSVLALAVASTGGALGDETAAR
ncbi:MAG: 4'-phosphopantetheinyl transferase superfamily protein [Elusimicrobia bacterium]|nr:4'-phosphopantetheinyl transferase superfamily protein [Elusimicrobiota bacterium]